MIFVLQSNRESIAEVCQKNLPIGIDSDSSFFENWNDTNSCMILSVDIDNEAVCEIEDSEVKLCTQFSGTFKEVLLAVEKFRKDLSPGLTSSDLDLLDELLEMYQHFKDTELS
jgi:hypothetical protein